MTAKVSRIGALAAITLLIMGATGCNSPSILEYLQHQPLPPRVTGTDPVCKVPYCAFVLFNAPFKPAAGQTVAHLTVQISNATTPLPLNAYNVIWQGPIVTNRGCATNDTNNQKTFPCDPSRTYTFIVYFTGNTWPLPGTAGAEVLLKVN